MSKKDVEKYAAQITAQYSELIDILHDLEKEAAENLVEPERIERLKDQIAPIKQNYERISYIMYLYNKPTRKNKQPRYEQMNKKLLKKLSSSNSPEAVLKENDEILTKIGK